MSPGADKRADKRTDKRAGSWLEASARERASLVLDDGSFREVLGPEHRERSPHLPLFDLPRAFDDGIVVGHGAFDGAPALVAAQEGRFMGGTFGEVSGAKLVGLLRAAREGLHGAAREGLHGAAREGLHGAAREGLHGAAREGLDPAAREGLPSDGRDGGGGQAPRVVLLALDTGGVRLQEANAGELAVSETIRAIVEARAAGVAVIALVGGRAGAFGGGGIVAATCSAIVMSRHGRTGVTGPEVIETNRGVEEFDARDRALVWRVTGGRTRRLLGGADRVVPDTIHGFRNAAIGLLRAGLPALGIAALDREHARLADRLDRHGASRDAPALWRRDGVAEPDRVADMDDAEFASLLGDGEPHAAR